MASPEPDDPIARLVQEFLDRNARGENVVAGDFARSRSGGDEALRTRLLGALTARADPGGVTRALGDDPERTLAAAGAAPPAAEQGRRIDGRYVVERQLGEGGFGIVYLVRDDVHKGNLRALKTLRGELAKDTDLSQRFRNEIITVKAISHRYVPRFHNDGRTAEGDLYYVMDFVDGVRLDDVLRKEGPLAPDRIVNLVRQILEVLDFAHQKSVFHRDLKPANIILVKPGTAEEEVRVLDFGIAKIDAGSAEFSEAESMHTLQGGAMGTPHYMAPEQVTGRGVIDGKTDLYALGIIIYQMCSGRVPFTGKTSMEVAAARLTHAPPPLDDDTPEWLRNLVMRLLERQKEKRPDTNELRAQFDHLSRGQRDLQRMMTWVGAGLLAIALGVAWLLYESGSDDEVAQRTVPLPAPGKLEGPGPGPRRDVVQLPAVEFRAPADGLRVSNPDIDVVVEARGRALVKIGDRNVEVGADGLARAVVRVPTDQPARIHVRDEDGAELAVRNVYADTKKPVLSVEKPVQAIESGGRWLTAERRLTVRGVVDDGPDGLLAEQPVSLGGDGQVARDDNGGGFEAIVELTEGPQDLAIRAVDAVGLVTTSVRTVVADFTDPVVSFTTPAAPVSADSLRLEGRVTDALECTASLARVGADGEPKSLSLDASGRFSVAVDLVTGPNEFAVSATDAVGRTSRRTFTVERTRAAAAIAMVEPASGRTLSARDATVRVAATSNVRPARVEVTRGGASVETVLRPMADGFELELPLTFGHNVFRLVPYDADGRPGAAFDVTYVRESAPAPQGCTLPNDVELDASGRPMRVVHERSGLELVLVEGGSRNGAEVAPFYVARREFTIGDMNRLRAGFYAPADNRRPDHWDSIAKDRDRHPAASVTFEEARELCAELGLRLPTPEEWELAAGAADGRAYPFGAAWTAGAGNVDDAADPFPRTAPVGSFALDVAPCGAFDLAGNVSEWCLARGGSRPELRGGNWNSVPESCRIDQRLNPPAGRSSFVGFRPALDAPPVSR